MEGLGGGYEAFVERMQMDMATSNGFPNTTINSSINPSQAQQIPQSRYVGYPSPSNAFTVKREATPTLSNSSGNSMSMDVSMQEPLSSSATGPSRAISSMEKFSTDVSQMPDIPPRRSGHRRAQSETAFRLPDDVMFDADLGFTGFDVPNFSDDGVEDLISMYMDMEKLNTLGESSNSAGGSLPPLPVEGSRTSSGTNNNPTARHSRSLSVDAAFSELEGNMGGTAGGVGSSGASRPRHRHSNSMDGSTSLQIDRMPSETIETKKAMAASKLAELALLDPKRAKRILANRQSAVRSKERKMRYISELERKVQTLQTEATTLSAQLTMLQRDTTGLTSENNELKIRLQHMEQQAQLRDALNEALREKIQRLKIATGQFSQNNKDAFNMGTTAAQMPLNPSFFTSSQQSHHLNQQLQSLKHPQYALNNQPLMGQTQAHSVFPQHVPVSQYQAFVGGQGGSFVETDASSSSINGPDKSSI